MSDESRRLYPLLFQPVLKHYIWGGRNLERILGRNLPPDGIVAESWDIAAHEDGASVITNGIYAGHTLTAVFDTLGIELVGRRNSWALERHKFPLLVKLLDANDKLSVQVHPNDEYALAYEGNELGKTEMWVILHAEPGSEIVLGVKPGTHSEVFRRAIIDGALEQYLHRVPVSAGDFVCVPTGTIHAILGGILIAEIQQNSNTTYRVYDWNRSQNGVSRPLHIDKALEVSDFGIVEPQLGLPSLIENSGGIRREVLCRNQYFTTERVKVGPGTSFDGMLDGETLEIWGVIEGDIHLNEVELAAVEFSLLPATMGAYRIYSTGGAICLRTFVT